MEQNGTVAQDAVRVQQFRELVILKLSNLIDDIPAPVRAELDALGVLEQIKAPLTAEELNFIRMEVKLVGEMVQDKLAAMTSEER